jgi:hypothetical protein
MDAAPGNATGAPTSSSLTQDQRSVVWTATLVTSLLSLMGSSFVVICYFLMFSNQSWSHIPKLKKFLFKVRFKHCADNFANKLVHYPFIYLGSSPNYGPLSLFPQFCLSQILISRPLVQLSAWTAMAQSLWFGTNIIDRILVMTGAEGRSSGALCLGARVIFEFGSFSSLLWTVCTGVFVLFCAASVFTPENPPETKHYIMCHALSWAISAVVASLPIVFKDQTKFGGTMLFYPPLAQNQNLTCNVSYQRVWKLLVERRVIYLLLACSGRNRSHARDDNLDPRVYQSSLSRFCSPFLRLFSISHCRFSRS